MSHDRTTCLSHCKVVAAQDIRNTTNSLHLLTLECGRKAVFRPKSLEVQYEWSSIQPGEYFKKEVVTSLIARILDLNIFPMTQVRSIRNHDGAIQEYVDRGRDTALRDVLTPYKLAEIAAFDFITGNTHRHKDHYIIDKYQGVWITNAALSLHFEDVDWTVGSLFLEQAIHQHLVIPDALKKTFMDKSNKLADTIFLSGIYQAFDTSFWVRKRIMQLNTAYTFDELYAKDEAQIAST